MKHFKDFLPELFKPKEIGLFKKGVKHITKVDQRQNKWVGTLESLMTSYGFKFSGVGKYAAVYVHPQYKYAIKVFMKDAAYLKYINWCKKNQNNKFVPEIRGKVVKITPIFMAIRIEKLDKFVEDDNYCNEFLEMCRDPEDFLDGYLIYDKIKKDDKDAVALCKILEANMKLRDIHEGNMMVRGKTPVLIDPFYNYFRDSKFSMDPDDISSFEAIF